MDAEIMSLKVKGHTTCQELPVLLMQPTLVFNPDISLTLYSGRPSIEPDFSRMESAQQILMQGSC